MFSVHMALIAGVCALIHALRASQEARLGTPALPVEPSPEHWQGLTGW